MENPADMIEFYAQIKWVHIASVICSGGLFVVRGLLVQSGRQAFAMAAPLRFLSYTVDVILLTAAMMLLTILPAAMFENGWLAIKLLLLPVYIVLGSFALKRGSTPGRRRTFYVLALLVFCFMASVARSHQPWGIFARLTS